MENVLSTHISEYYHRSAKQTPFNVIHATLDDGAVKFETRPDHLIARPIRSQLQYDPEKGENAIPAVHFSQLLGEVYFGRAIDKCRWKNQK